MERAVGQIALLIGSIDVLFCLRLKTERLESMENFSNWIVKVTVGTL